MPSFPFYQQLDQMDCGPSCLRMIARYFGKSYSLQGIRDMTGISREGVSLLDVSEAAEKMGFRTFGARIGFDLLVNEAPLPCIVHLDQRHFVVIVRITRKKALPWSRRTYSLVIADPQEGIISYTREEFLSRWRTSPPDEEAQGIALFLEPTPTFHEQPDEQTARPGYAQLFSYVLSYKKLLGQILAGLLVGAVLQVALPFTTQAIIDVGINTGNVRFIYLILFAQLMLFAGRMSVEFIRSWILLHMGARINLSILSDFLYKLMSLPVAFFDTKMYGDIIQRVNDRHRIEELLTSSSLQTLFSVFSVCVLGSVLAVYHWPVFLVFLVGTGLYSLWISLFLKKQRRLDHKRFSLESANQSKLYELISGMPDIKLANSETLKRWEWERLQAKSFRLNIRTLSLAQYQQAGAFFIHEGKNILIIFLAARAVIGGEMTVGAMLAVTYIVGQLNSPVEQLVTFLQTLQNAVISLERLNEVHQLSDEHAENPATLTYLPARQTFFLKNVSFRYPGTSKNVLQALELYIPEGKTTAIVGMSGSGKTTLLKLLLKFYEPTEGEIRVGDAHLKNLSHPRWRANCGVVMQDGFIFSDTIAHNITLGDANPDIERLFQAVKIANIGEFIESLPLGYNTKIGAEGNGISQGQRQRILIARAVYKNPQVVFFDEATNALDATNETVIMQNLEQFFSGRTVIIVAHRLSTVQNADQIVVLHQGEISEVGTHAELTGLRGDYYRLVKNQLELGV